MEINLLKKYPVTRRNLDKRKTQKNPKSIEIARRFEKDFFDGDKQHGYGGHYYNEKFWSGVVDDFIKHYKLTNQSSILDVGCAKGFMLYDFKKKLPNLKVTGIDISKYAISNGKEELKDFLKVGNAKKLDFNDNSFDLVIAINTIHNLEEDDCATALREIQRVTKKNAYVVLDAYSNEIEREKMFSWNLTGKTIKHKDEWKFFFKKNNYLGDYYWFTP